MLHFFSVKRDFFFWDKIIGLQDILVYWPGKVLLSEILKSLIIWYLQREIHGLQMRSPLGSYNSTGEMNNGKRFQPA